MKNNDVNNNSFFKKVYTVVHKIPFGKVTTYGAVAKYLGASRSARMVGWAMNSSHNVLPSVPAHRVVNRNGLLTGKYHFESPTLMQELLENEGLIIVNNQIKDFKKYLWDPSEHLTLHRKQ